MNNELRDLKLVILTSGASRAVRVPHDLWCQALEAQRPAARRSYGVDFVTSDDEPRTHFVYLGKRIVADCDVSGIVVEP